MLLCSYSDREKEKFLFLMLKHILNAKFKTQLN